MPTDTFPITSGNDDATFFKSQGVWASLPFDSGTGTDGGSTVTVAWSLSGIYYVFNVLLRFDTSSLPDTAVISSANLKMYAAGIGNPDSTTYAADYYDYGGAPVVAADWELTSSGNCISSINPAAMSSGAVNTLALTTLSGISVSGYTGIRIAPTNSSPPSGDNFIDFAAFEGSDQEPRLEVTYTVPAAGSSIAWIRA